MTETSNGRFRSLAAVHAAITAGEASMVVALADSFFFDVDLDGARSRLLAFLLVGFTPFLVVARLIGPFIDRFRGGRRAMVMTVAALRLVVQIAMIGLTDEFWLFPLVFAALVLQKTYAVSKQALVPAVVPSSDDLVEANSKLGLIAGLTGAAAVVPAAGLQYLLGPGATLAYGATFFAAAVVLSRGLPGDIEDDRSAPSAAEGEVTGSDIHVAWVAMTVLRFAVGFTLFQIAFWFRADGASAIWLAAAIGLGSGAPMLGNIIGPRLKRLVGVEPMLAGALVIPAIVAGVAAVVGGYAMAVAVSVSVNLALAVARLAFETIVQRDGPESNQGAAFATFETRFHFGWVAGATVPVLVDMPGTLGLTYLAVVVGVGAVTYIVGAGANRPPLTRYRDGRATARER